jgi:hypothetical protein
MREFQRTLDVPRVTSGLYLVAGFAGATLIAAGVLQIFETWPWALALALLGGAIAAGAWHRGRAVLGNADRAITTLVNVSDALTSPVRARRRRNRPPLPNPRVTEAP